MPNRCRHCRADGVPTPFTRGRIGADGRPSAPIRIGADGRPSAANRSRLNPSLPRAPHLGRYLLLYPPPPPTLFLYRWEGGVAAMSGERA